MKLIKKIKDILATTKTKVLEMGTPPKDDVLYKKVIKRKVPKESAEKLLIQDFKKSFKKVFTVEENVEFARGTPNPPVKKASKRKSPSKKPATKKTVTKKSTTTKKKKEVTNKTTTSIKKPVTKKTTTKKSNTKKETEKETTVKKPSTKKVINKKPATKTTSTKKETSTISKKIATKTSTTKAKKPAVKKVSKRDEKIALYSKDIKKHYGEVDEDFVAIIVKNLGPSIYRRDAELVSCSDPKELDTVRKNFLMKKLGIEASQSVLDAAIQDVCTELKGVRTKYRATFYYSLAKKFKKESTLS
jgi:hypothetical protein